ncbi:Trp biosynthesis-associated membrane protein [Yaniella halotolerans]|uniref:Trp biosynthesis-associated membrane protein n=1 Tax=Yaniella halotolerans TaxID=225453 RepID=UPI0003B47A2A|nr:Trp biosynthesis-associated membrane protein [Yaniella halotolerans]
MTTPLPIDNPQSSKGLNRGMTVLVLLIGGALALIGSTQTWVTAAGFEATHLTQMTLSGQEASPVITAMSLVTIAAGAALSIARNIGRWIIGCVAILGALAIGATTINVLVNPFNAAAQKISESTGTTATTNAVENIEVSLLPWLTVLGAVIVLVGGIIALTQGSRWSLGKTKKYDVNQPTQANHDGPLDEIDTWDELSRGEDPT